MCCVNSRFYIEKHKDGDSRNGQVLAFGSPGGSTIIATVVGIATNLMDFGTDLSAEIAAPRFGQRNSGVTLVEPKNERCGSSFDSEGASVSNYGRNWHCYGNSN